jgi:hypothetical protein
MFKHQTVVIKNSGAACYAIEYHVVDIKQRLQLARAVIERAEPHRVVDILHLEQRYLFRLPAVWRKRALQVVLKDRKGSADMQCMAVLPVSAEFAEVRGLLLQRMIRDGLQRPMKKGTEYDCILTQFWSQKFSPAEEEIITEEVISSGNADFAESWIYLLGKYSPGTSLSPETISKLEVQAEGLPE